LENIIDWGVWGGGEVFQSFLGGIWIGVLLMFIMFFVKY
jgi:hypothetical protein